MYNNFYSEKPDVNEVLSDYQAERKKYKEIKKTQKKKGSDRESATLAMLAKFQSKLSAAKQFSVYNDEEEVEEGEVGEKTKEEEKSKDKEDKSKDKTIEEGEEMEEEEDDRDLSWYGL